MSLEVFYEKIIRIEIKLNRSNFNKFRILINSKMSNLLIIEIPI